MKKVVASIRFTPKMLDELRQLAHLKSLETGEIVTWTGLVRECVKKHLLSKKEQGKSGGK